MSDEALNSYTNLFGAVVMTIFLIAIALASTYGLWYLGRILVKAVKEALEKK